MSKKHLIIVFALAVILIGAMPVMAITNGRPDNGEHPMVGLAVMFNADGRPLWRCSGTMIAPRVFLTAGHCTEAPAASAEVWFLDDVDASAHYPYGGSDSIHGSSVYTHPEFSSGPFYMHDAGIIILDADVPEPYGELPPLGILDELAKGPERNQTRIKAVGYGLQKINPVEVVGFRIRLQADLRILDVNGTAGIPAGTSVMLSNNAKTGGTCFGDSGGPLFLNDTLTIVAVTSFGLNGNCAGTGGGYRIDQPDDLAWISSFLP